MGNNVPCCAEPPGDDEPEPELNIKEGAQDGSNPLVICVCGAAGVGKTSLVRRMLLNECPEEHVLVNTPGQYPSCSATLDYHTTLRAGSIVDGERGRVGLVIRDSHGPLTDENVRAMWCHRLPRVG
jgi:hypothetical protein